jgi:hypothetical protein
MSKCLSFLRLNNNLLSVYVCDILFIHPLMCTWFNAHVLAIVNDAAINLDT